MISLKRNKGVSHFSFQNLPESKDNQDIMVQAQRQKQISGIELNSRYKPRNLWSANLLTRVPRQLNWQNSLFNKCVVQPDSHGQNHVVGLLPHNKQIKVYQKCNYKRERTHLPVGRHKRHGLSPLVGKIPWRMAWPSTSVFLPEKIPWTEKPGKLQSMGLQGVRHDSSDLINTHIKVLEDSTGKNLHYLVFVKEFLDMILKAQQQQKDK